MSATGNDNDFAVEETHDATFSLIPFHTPTIGLQ